MFDSIDRIRAKSNEKTRFSNSRYFHQNEVNFDKNVEKIFE